MFFFVRSKRECYHGETFIASNAKVDSHIHKVYQGVKHNVSRLFAKYRYSQFSHDVMAAM